MQTSLLSRERHEAISIQLRQFGRVLASDLARLFDVSEDTIRRDLREMAAAGRCLRVYGGALALPAEQPFLIRNDTSRAAKHALAKAAVAILRDGMTLFIDAGSTNLAIVEAIPARLSLTIVTNMPAIALAALRHSQLEVVTIGGRIDRHVGAAIGAQAERELEALRPDVCVLGACGLHPEAGLTGLVYDDVAFKRMAAQRASALLVACTSDKLETIHPFVIAPLGRTMTLVLEADASEAARTRLQATGATVLQADALDDTTETDAHAL